MATLSPEHVCEVMIRDVQRVVIDASEHSCSCTVRRSVAVVHMVHRNLTPAFAPDPDLELPVLPRRVRIALELTA